ncbi:hypothetical protein RND81_04G207500 [Saponaria officinalis]|uniref:HIG1 domain-containing protein n=1 Tax=Saponaria officinalis TaxID=3572 RepID=A0AAW1LPI2_SAPOF
MAESSSTFESARHWIAEHKLRTVGCLWLSGIAGSIAYNWSRPTMKTSVRLIHARLHAQALTLAALVGAASIEYFDHKNSPVKANDPYAKFVPLDSSHKN